MGGFGDFLFGSGGQDPQAFRAPGYEQQGQLLNMLALGGAITPEQIAQQRSQLQSRIDASPAPEVPSFVPTPYSKEDILAGMGQQGTFDGAQQFGSQLAPDFQGQMDFLNSLEDASKFGPGGGQPLQELGVLNTKDLDPLQALSFQQRNPFQFDFQGPDTVNFDPRQAVGDAFTPFAERIQSQIGRFGQRQDADLMEDLNRRGLLTAGAGTEALGRARETRGDQLSEALLGLSGQQAQQQLGASQFGAGLQAQQNQQIAQSQQQRQLSQAQELFRQQGATDAQAQALAQNAISRRGVDLGAQQQQFGQQFANRQMQQQQQQQPYNNLFNLYQLSTGAQPGSAGSPGFLGTVGGAAAEGAGMAAGMAAFCLPKGTKIETENGALNVEEIKPGEIVKGGRVVAINSCERSKDHKFYEHKFKNGTVVMSKGHPYFEELLNIKVSENDSEFTYDILTTDGFYYVNGVKLGSTMGGQNG